MWCSHKYSRHVRSDGRHCTCEWTLPESDCDLSCFMLHQTVYIQASLLLTPNIYRLIGRTLQTNKHTSRSLPRAAMVERQNAEGLISSIRDQCLRRGLNGTKGLAALFRGMDRDYSKHICMPEFVEGLCKFGIRMEEEDLRRVFSYIDKDKSGYLDFREFLFHLRPPMPQCRVEVIDEAFDKLDVNKDGILKIEDVKHSYRHHAEQHPKYLYGDWTLDQVLQNFLDSFDSPEDRDGMVTRDEFLHYYASVSSTVQDNAYFDLMMRSCWGLPPRGANH